MTPQQWHDTVGRHIRDRREALRLSIRAIAKKADVSDGLWRQLESGKRQVAKGIIQTVNPKAETTAAASRALGWTPDSIDRLLAGEPPKLLEPVSELDQDAAAMIVAAIAGATKDATAVMKQTQSELSSVEHRLGRIEAGIEALLARPSGS